MSNGSAVNVTALNELLGMVLSGNSTDDSTTQLKLLNMIVKRGLETTIVPKGKWRLILTLFLYNTNSWIDLTRSLWIEKCLSAIELLCEKKPLLLNGESEDLDVPIYKRILQSLIPLLSTGELSTLKKVKSTVITIIHVITTKLRLFSHKKDIKKFFLHTLDSHIADLFKTSIEDKLIALLAISANLLSLLTDQEVRNKLMIETFYDQKFESSARKLDYLISSLNQESRRSAAIDSIRSQLISGMLNYTTGGEFLIYSRVKFFLGLCFKTIQSPVLASHTLTQLSLSYALLKTLVHTNIIDNLDLYASALSIDTASEIIFHNPSLDPELVRVFRLLNHICSDDGDDEILITRFKTQDLDALRHSIMFKVQLLHSDLLKLNYLYQGSTLSGDNRLEEWVKTMRSSLAAADQDFESSEVVGYSVITSLGEFFCMHGISYRLKKGICSLCCKPTLDLTYIKEDRPDVTEYGGTLLAAYQLFAKNGLAFAMDPDHKTSILSMATLLAIHKLFTHFQPPKIEAKCPFYKFLSSCVVSVNRDVRLFSGRILPLYFISKNNKYDSNSMLIFELLNGININDKVYLAESTIMSWGLLAMASEGERLNAIIFKLIDFLGSSNSFQSSIAFHELQVIASAKDKTPWQLLSPVMPTLSLMIAKQLLTRPNMGQRIAELVGLSVSTILARTETQTVPYLLTYYKTDLIGEISKATGKKKLELVLDNRAKIFAVLLTSIVDVSEGKLHSILSNVCPEFKTLALADLIVLIPTVWEILKMYSAELKNEEKIKASISFVFRITSGEESKQAFSQFFERHILGVVQQFSDAIHDTKGLQPYVEKLKALNAIELLVQIAGSSIVSALPQIITCLQAALEVDLLRETSLRCWRILIQQLEESHLVTILDLSLAIVIQRWESFDDSCKKEAKSLLTAFFDKSEAFRSKHVYCFLSLSANDELLEIYSKVHHIIRKNERPNSLLYDITRRCKNDNKYVVKQALLDLNRFLLQYQNEFYTNNLPKPSFAPVVSTLYAVLFDILYKFKSIDDITIQCSKCLGLIGALDPTKYEVERKRDQMIIASDFEDPKETVRFLLKFIDQHLVPAFWASEDPGKQLFLAYAMQEFLKLCGLDSSRIKVDRLDPNSHEYLLWSQFSDIAKSTLTPLVSSKYSASVSNYDPLEYPIYDVTKDHSKWLRQFTLDLLKKAKGNSAEPIFFVCSSIVKDQDLSFCTFILPYAALNLVISQDKHQDIENIRKEIMAVLSTSLDSVHHLAADSLRLSYESIFNLLDYFRKWVFARKQLLKRKNIKKADPAIQSVSDLLDSIPQQLMAIRSLQSNSYERAILYMEQCYRTQSYDSFGDSFFSTMQNMYANIGDIDALDGVLKKFSTKSLNDRITELEYSDHWRMAQDCFEALGTINGVTEIDADTRLLNSLYSHDLYDQTLQKLNSLLMNPETKTDSKHMKQEWLNSGLEASFLSGNIDELRKWVNKVEDSKSYTDNQLLVNYHISKGLLYWSMREEKKLLPSLENAYLLIGGRLSMSRPISLNKSRSMLVTLHSLSDISAIHNQNHDRIPRNNASSLIDIRLENTGNDFKAKWYISSLRRLANSLSKSSGSDTDDTWVSASKIARKHNRLDLATSSIMHAIKLKSPNTDLEYAKILWAQGDHTRALKLMEDLKNDQKPLSAREKASVQLKYTKWLDYSNNSSSTRIIEEYSAAIKLDPTWEKGYYGLGKYYNKILDLKTTPSTEKINPKDISGEYERRTISFYLKAMQCGTKYLYEALPKVITVWLDFSANISEVPGELQDTAKVTVLAERRKHLQNIHDDITKASERLPKYVWYTVFSQLLSRILHPNKVTSQLIIMISHLVVQEYPTHALWSVLAQYKSTQAERSRKAKKILELFSSSDSRNPSISNATLLQASKKLFNELIEVSKKQLPKVKGPLSLKDDFNFDHSCVPCPMVVPAKTNFDITLPTSVQALKYHNPFPNSSRVTINRFDNRVDVLSSMQQPRHLYLRGSNGLTYSILCKPNDDLRKDAKLMEFTTMVDHLLRKDYESEQRKLHIKTYAVIPLNENYGIIEWVENSRTMRDILKVHYSNINKGLDIASIRKVLDKDCDISEKAALFKTDILDQYPPVLYHWFIENFPDPSSWYDARNNYTRTTAVMSMVGYMLGLGDRHGENLLFNEKDGGILHVDFDCLFEKGLELTVPERVPFRLTNNMVDAFGVTGVEGTFRKSCEVTLSLLRGNETTLMNILESFLHDPIMDWSHKRKTRNTPQSALSTIRRKIRGILDKEGLPMSTQGQAEFLIQQATSLENLCQMYIGWMAFW